jgi:hypothetical protein
MRFKSLEERYAFRVRRERRELEAFVDNERLESDMVIERYRLRGADIPDDMYRAAVFFRNGEYRTKVKPLVLLFEARERVAKETAEMKITRERVFDLVCYKYQVYGRILLEGAY